MGRRKKEPKSTHREKIASAASVFFMEKNKTMGLSKLQFLEYGFHMLYCSIADRGECTCPC